MNAFNVVSKETLEYCSEFFGSGPYHLTDKTNLGEILLELGLIESKSWARKNGWWREAGAGFNRVVFGKNKTELWIFIKLRGEA